MNLSKIEEKEIFPGYFGKLIHGEKITWAFWRVNKGSEVAEHSHPHEQMMHVIEGEFNFTLDGNSMIYTAGDVVHIPSNVSHSGKALTDCKLMDVFSPAREEYK